MPESSDIPPEGLTDELPEGLPDETREWILKVSAMNYEDAQKARLERHKQTMAEETWRRNREEFLNEIP